VRMDNKLRIYYTPRSVGMKQKNLNFNLEYLLEHFTNIFFKLKFKFLRIEYLGKKLYENFNNDVFSLNEFLEAFHIRNTDTVVTHIIKYLQIPYNGCRLQKSQRKKVKGRKSSKYLLDFKSYNEYYSDLYINSLLSRKYLI
jgi:hypothetical protein